MKFLVAFSLLVAASQASFLVPKGINNCPGSENYPFQLVSGEMPDEIYLPGTVTLTTKVNVLEQLPEDLIIEMKLKKLEPFPMEVPCLNGLGSCPYDMCQTIVNLGDALCATFPPSQPCGCPIFAGELDMKEVEIPIPDFGPILGSLMEGTYDATATIYGKSNPSKTLGCLEMHFSFKKA